MDAKRQDPPARAAQLLEPWTTRLEERLEAMLTSTVELIPEVSRHLIGSGGKRIRPLVLLLTGAAAKSEPGRLLDLAVAAELLHNATLLHDDVVDRGELRRGVSAAPRVYGNSASVLVGDFLLARALSLVIGHGDLGLLREYARMLAEMAEGEVLQLLRSGRLAVEPHEYVAIISGKTAGLFAWCGRAGASVAGDALLEPASRFGQAFGMAFQVADDILDYTAAPAESGKEIAQDLLQGKATLPLLLACSEDPGLQALVSRSAVEGQVDPATCREIIARVLETSAIARSLAEAQAYVSEARSHLALFPHSPERAMLEELAEFTVSRLQLQAV